MAILSDECLVCQGPLTSGPWHVGVKNSYWKCVFLVSFVFPLLSDIRDTRVLMLYYSIAINISQGLDFSRHKTYNDNTITTPVKPNGAAFVYKCYTPTGLAMCRMRRRRIAKCIYMSMNNAGWHLQNITQRPCWFQTHLATSTERDILYCTKTIPTYIVFLELYLPLGRYS